MGVLLAMTTLVAMTTNTFLAPDQSSFTMVLVIELIVGLLTTELLVRNLPRAIRHEMIRNCRRADGSWSHRRRRIEADAIGKLRRNIISALILIAIPTNIVFWYVNSEVIPVDISWDAIASMRFSKDDWKDNLRDEELAFDKWARSKHVSSAAIRARKQQLWNGWPLILVGLAGSCVVAFFAFAAAYSYALKELWRSIEFRANQYRMQDLGRVEMRNDSSLKRPASGAK